MTSQPIELTKRAARLVREVVAIKAPRVGAYIRPLFDKVNTHGYEKLSYSDSLKIIKHVYKMSKTMECKGEGGEVIMTPDSFKSAVENLDDIIQVGAFLLI